MIKQCVIIGGGLGTRLTKAGVHTPKLLLNIDGKSLLQIQMEQLKIHGIKKFTFLLGYNSNPIIKEIEIQSQELEVNADYIVENVQTGTGGALISALHILDEKFLLVYGDILFNTNLDQLIQKCEDTHVSCFLTRPSDHFFDSDIVGLNEDNFITEFFPKPIGTRILRNIALTGIYSLIKKDVELLLKLNKTNFSFDHDGIPFLLDYKKQILSVSNLGYVRDIGTIERYSQAKIDWLSSASWKNKKKIIFLDRDGVINSYYHKDIATQSDFRIIEGFAESVQIFRELDYLIFVVTNQPGISKGFLDWQKLYELHAIVDIELAKNGLYLDGWFVCPHHPEKGFQGEISSLKIVCRCRKPETKMYEQIELLYPIDHKNSWMVGDQEIDRLAAGNFKINFAGIGSNFLMNSSKVLSFTRLLKFAQYLSESKE
jgi:mannose-1-phosphate guanylyltransferase/phosphomannomutase